MQNMESKTILDANAILRFLLLDNEEQFRKIKELLLRESCYVPLEVLAEVVYVLESVYEVPRTEIAEVLRSFVNDVVISDADVFLRAIEAYKTPPKMDFVDCLLYGYKMARGYDVFTFDVTLRKQLAKIE